MENYFDLRGRVALVTGASSGLGAQFAHALASQGADVALIARREEKLQKVKAEIAEKYGNHVEYYCLDVTDFDQIPEVVSRVEEDFGHIDILVNNAGLSLAGPALKSSREDWMRMMDTNLNGVFFMAQAVGNVMVKQNYGRIINIGSIHSKVSMKTEHLKGDYLIAYVTTKHAVRGMTIALAAGWAEYGITVNAIGPGYFDSEMTHDMLAMEGFQKTLHCKSPFDRPGREGELNTTLLYLASEYSSYTNGQIIYVDGGWTIL